MDSNKNKKTRKAEGVEAAHGSEERKDDDLSKYEAYKNSVDQMQQEALQMLYPDAILNMGAVANLAGENTSPSAAQISTN